MNIFPKSGKEAGDLVNKLCLGSVFSDTFYYVLALL